MTEPTISAPLETLRKRVQEATQRLLGDTIGIPDAEWNLGSRLPGWSRANVAAHVAANAEALAAATDAAVAGTSVELYPDPERRRADIEAGSALSGLDLQIRLDTTAGQLESALDAVQDWSTPIRLQGRELTVAQVPLARLAEVTAHHLDLSCDFDLDRLDPTVARWLLQWALFWHATDADLPAVRLESSSGVVAELGSGTEPRPITGTDARLWAWVLGRRGLDGSPDADGARLAVRS